MTAVCSSLALCGAPLFSGHSAALIATLAQDWWNGANIDSIWARQIPPPSVLSPFQAPLHALCSHLICHYLLLSHSLSSPRHRCHRLSFHPLCVPGCQSHSVLRHFQRNPSAACVWLSFLPGPSYVPSSSLSVAFTILILSTSQKKASKAIKQNSGFSLWQTSVWLSLYMQEFFQRQVLVNSQSRVIHAAARCGIFQSPLQKEKKKRKKNTLQMEFLHPYKIVLPPQC